MKENKKLKELIQRYEQTIAENRTIYLDSDEYIEIASYYWTDGQIMQAHAVLDQAQLIHPGNDEILYTLLEFYMDEGEYVKARNLLNSLSNSHSFGLKYIDAELHYEENQPQKALAILDELYETNTNEDVFINMAELYSDMDKNEKAISCLKIADKISPNNEDVLQPLASLLFETGKYEEALELYNRFIDKDPYSAYAWLKIAECYFGLSEYGEAIEAAEFAMVSEPENDAPYVVRGQAYIALDNYEKALDDILRALDQGIVPNEYLLYYAGVCYLNLGKPDKAIDYLLWAEADTKVTQQPFFHNLIYSIVNCLYNLGRIEEARTYAALLMPDTPEKEIANQLLALDSDEDSSHDGITEYEED